MPEGTFHLASDHLLIKLCYKVLICNQVSIDRLITTITIQTARRDVNRRPIICKINYHQSSEHVCKSVVAQILPSFQTAWRSVVAFCRNRVWYRQIDRSSEESRNLGIWNQSAQQIRELTTVTGDPWVMPAIPSWNVRRLRAYSWAGNTINYYIALEKNDISAGVTCTYRSAEDTVW